MTKVHFQFISPQTDWSVFYEIDKLTYLPTKLTIKSEYEDKGGDDDPLQSGLTIEYSTFINGYSNRSLDFYGDDEYWSSGGSMWVEPSVCRPPGNSQKAFPKIAKKLKIVFSEKDELSDREAEERGTAVLDFESDLVSIENKTTDLTSIYASKQVLRFDFSSLFPCKTHFNKADDVYQKSKLIRLLRQLADEKDDPSQDDYVFVGSKTIRGSVTDAFRKALFRPEDPLKPKHVTTIYLAQSGSDDIQQKIYQVEFEEFHYPIGELKGEYVEHLRYDLYEFETVFSESELSKTFDVSECVEESMAAQFSLIGQVAYKDVEDIIQGYPNNEALKKRLRSLLIEKSGLTALNFPKIQVHVYPKEAIAEISFVDIVNPMVYFEDSITLRQKASADHLVDVRTPVKCAIESLKFIHSAGFQYCEIEDETYCDLFTRLAVAKRGRNCTTMVKKESVKDEFKYEGLEEKLAMLKKMVENKELRITLDNLQIDFHTMHLKRKLDIDKRTLYGRQAKGLKIADKKAQRILGTEDGIKNPTDCYKACVNTNNDFSCDTFSFCKRFDVLAECSLANSVSYDDSTGDLKDFTETDQECDLFSVYSLMHFEEHQNKKLVEDKKILQSFVDASSNDCAQSCLNYNHENKNAENHCNSMEICQDYSDATCRLSSEQTIWQGEGAIRDDQDCNVYSLKHLLNFLPTSKAKLTDFVSQTVDSLDQCATLCEVAGDCDRFNYCEQGDEKRCRYLSKKYDGKLENTKLESEELGCSSYVHDKTQLGALPRDQDSIQPRNYTTYALVCFLIGAFLGATAFYHCKSSRSRQFV